jgi:7,8-dihydropterin-6-yl-methyl-4-(beta-D-ribofuranosyl)aminobenzene 5'-phosphate synthase
MYLHQAIQISVLTAILAIAADNLPASQGHSMNEKPDATKAADVNYITIKVVYDNNPYKDGLQTAWGFSAFITSPEKTILFDTGADSPRLLSNMKKLAIDVNSIDIVVLSHIHGDHIGGLDGLLEKNSKVAVYLPKSFPANFKQNVQARGASIVEVQEPLQICGNVYTTGQLGTSIIEQSLIVRTKSGLIVITGCAHPGIVKIVNTAKELMKDDILLVMGGFHLNSVPENEIEKIISAFKKAQIKYAAPCHCTGDEARSLFEKQYGKYYINVGVGKMITGADLQ